MVILFSHRDDMLRTWNIGSPPTVGRLAVGYNVLEMQPSAATAESDQQLARMPNAYEVCGLLGLKLRLPDDTEAISNGSLPTPLSDFQGLRRSLPALPHSTSESPSGSHGFKYGPLRH